MSGPYHSQPAALSKSGRGGVVLAVITGVVMILLAVCLVAAGLFYFSGGMQSEAFAFLHSPTPTRPTSTPRPTHTPRPSPTATLPATVTPTEADYPGTTRASDYLIILRSENPQLQQHFTRVQQRLESLGYRVQSETSYGVIGAVDVVQYGHLDCLETIEILHRQLSDLLVLPDYEERFGSTDLSYEVRNIVIQLVDEALIVGP